jgi:hypothetical protein
MLLDQMDTISHTINCSHWSWANMVQFLFGNFCLFLIKSVVHLFHGKPQFCLNFVTDTDSHMLVWTSIGWVFDFWSTRQICLYDFVFKCWKTLSRGSFKNSQFWVFQKFKLKGMNWGSGLVNIEGGCTLYCLILLKMACWVDPMGFWQISIALNRSWIWFLQITTSS